MADHGTTIEWTQRPGTKGETWNPIAGCSVVSPGCSECYAMRRVAPRLAGNPATPHYAGTVMSSKGGPVWTGKIGVAGEAKFLEPLRWKSPRTIFTNSTSDLFHEGVPDEVIDRVFAVMALTPQHTYQVLTKRAARMREYMEHRERFRLVWNTAQAFELSGIGLLRQLRVNAIWPLPNVWLGVSVEDQTRADERIPHLLATPAAVRFVSAEPLLGPVDFTRIAHENGRIDHYYHALDGFVVDGSFAGENRIDWVIVGGESGHTGRPMHPDWVRSIRDQCAGAGTRFFFKQWGEWQTIYERQVEDPDWRRCDALPREHPDGRWLNLEGGHGFHGERVVYVKPVGKNAAGALLDGIEHKEFPE